MYAQLLRPYVHKRDVLTSTKNVRYAVIAAGLGVDANEDVKPLI